MKTIKQQVEGKLSNKPNTVENIWWWVTHANSKEEAIEYLTQALHERDAIAREEERWRCQGINRNYMMLNEKGEPNDPDAGKNDVLLEAIEDMNDPEQMPIGENGQYLTTPNDKEV